MGLRSELARAGIALDYGDAAGEASACRAAAALFDFSFMSRARVSGPGALRLLARLTPRPLADLPAGRIRYAFALDRHGSVVADLTVWCLERGRYELMSGRHEEIATLAAWAADAAAVEDLSAESAVLAVQGPASLAALAALAPGEALAAIPYFGHAALELAGISCRVGRLGYTGERGFEILLPRSARAEIWQALAARVRPAGFAAADILRIEAGFLLFANELAFPVTAGELGLERYAAESAAPRRVRLAAFRARADRRPILPPPPPPAAAFPPRPGEIVATSACWSPHAAGVLGLGYVRAEEPACAGLLDGSRRFHAVEEVALPFHDPAKRRPRGGWRCGDRMPE